MYFVSSVNDTNKTIIIDYENSKNIIDGTMDLLKHIQANYSFSVKNSKGKFELLSDEYKLEFYWIKGQGLSVHFIEFPNHSIFYDIIERCIWDINNKEAQGKLNEINEFLNCHRWFDFRISEYDGKNLYIIGGIDLSYFYQLEIVFKGVTYINCSDYFKTSPHENIVFSLGGPEDLWETNYSFIVKIKPEGFERSFYVACYDIKYSFEEVWYFKDLDAFENDKEKIIKKFGLFKENNGFYQLKENSHKALIFTHHFFENNDILGILFRIYKLCYAKVKYFRKNLDKFEPYKYHYNKGFILTDLWDSEFLKHKASGYMIDYRHLQSITVYQNFVAFYTELEKYE